jgi:uncharacterized secreted protein with C-terminal beta-propeller domain
MKKSVLFGLLVVSLFVLVNVFGAAVPLLFEQYGGLGNGRLMSFYSYEELKSFLKANSQISYPYYGESGSGRASLMTSNSAQFSSESYASSTSSFLPAYSKTNVQIEGVDEADFVKTDGEYIYVMSAKNLTIVKAYPPTDAEIVSQIKAEGTLRGLFINGDKLAVFEDLSPNEIQRTPTLSPAASYTPRTAIRVYNVADRSNPVSTRNVSIDGTYFNSRMIGEYVYTIANQYIYMSSNEVNPPRIYFNDKAEVVPATEIYYSDVPDRLDTYTHVTAINLLDDLKEPTHKTFLLGWASTTYVSQNNIYMTFSSYGGAYTGQRTIVHRIRIEDGNIEDATSGEVPGYVLNQFSMDEYNGYFRVATTTGEVSRLEEATSENHVYILDSNLNTVGKLENLGSGEKIHSARFMGDRGYLVTFKKIDPLFVLDLSDPTSPEVLGELKITGYSDYLHPYDETHIIGIGKETVEGEGGNFAWYQGIKISLFDVSDVEAPKEIAKYEIGDRGTDSPILNDHKAFLFDKSKNLLVIPVTVAEIDPSKYPSGVPPNAYGEPVWDGAYVFHLSLEEGLVFRGRITHSGGRAELSIWRWYGSSHSIKRSMYIDDVLYTISDFKIKMNSLTDLSEINELNLNP